MPYRARVRTDQIALQLWTVRTLTATDVPGTLRAVAAAGYRAVELAAIGHVDPVVLRTVLDDNGLSVVASHEPMAGLREDPAAVAARLAVLGCPRVIVPWLPEEERLTHSDVRRYADDLGRLAGVFADHGLGFGYHNHDFEFAPLDGTTIWEILLAELPASIGLELDVYWAARAGQDPVGLIAAARDRIRLLHMKDRSSDADERDAPAGEGNLDFPAIVETARAAGVEWYIAEQDEPVSVLDDIASAYRHLASLATSS